jgi:hypothetical protein
LKIMSSANMNGMRPDFSRPQGWTLDRGEKNLNLLSVNLSAFTPRGERSVQMFPPRGQISQTGTKVHSYEEQNSVLKKGPSFSQPKF